MAILLLSGAVEIADSDPKGARSTASLLLIVAGALAIGINAVMLTRIRTPEFDEVFFMSASKSLANGGPAMPWLTVEVRAGSQDAFYGPIWFHLQAAIIRWAGVSIYVARGLSLGGMVLMAIACAAAVRAAGASRPWPAAGFAFALWAPEIMPAMTGRMDTLAFGAALFGVAAYLAAVRRHELSKAVPLAILGGMAFAVGVLTTPRAGIIPVAMVAASPLLVIFGFERRRVIDQLAIMAGTAAVIVSLGLWTTGLTWTGWFATVLTGTVGTPDVSPLFGGVWFTYNATRMAPLPVFCAMFAVIALRRKNTPRVRGLVVFGLGFAMLATILTAVTFSDPFVRSVQFTSCWIIAALIAAGTLLEDRRRQAAIALGIVGLTCCGFRVNRYLEVAQSWSRRDPQRVEEFLGAHVPRDSTVYSGWTYYYALHSVGARVEAYHLRDLPLWRPTGGRRATASREPRFLVMPDPDEDTTASPMVTADCVTSNRVAVFEPAPLPSEGLLARLPIHAEPGAMRGYSRIFLYRLPEGCDIR